MVGQSEDEDSLDPLEEDSVDPLVYPLDDGSYLMHSSFFDPLTDSVNPLCDAVETNNVDLIEEILLCGAEDTEAINGAMIRAVELNRPEALQLLLAYGADIEYENNGGLTALMTAEDGLKTECLRALFLSDTTPHWGALVETVLDGNTEKLGTMLPHHVNLRNGWNETALLWAARLGQRECVLTLLERGAELDVQDNLGITALSYACWREHVDCVEALLTHGADTNIQSNNGLTALAWANAECVNALLPYEPDLRIQAHKWGTTALMDAARCADLEKLTLLLEYGPELDLHDNRGKTAMQMIGECAWNVSVEHQEACVQLFQQLIPDQTVTVASYAIS